MTETAPDPTGPSLLAVFAHPDDESIACGGLLALCADRGVRVSLVCATHGENRDGVRDMDLYERRPEELACAARILGIAEIVHFSYADGFLPWLDAVELRARIEAEIRRLRPDVVVTFGEDGLYWHPDHIAVHHLTTAAVAACGTGAPALYYVTMPPGQVRKIVRECVGEAGGAVEASPMFGVANPDAFGVKAGPPTLVVGIAEAAGRKLAALKCHRSQVGGSLARIPEGEAARFFAVEHFHRAAAGASGSTFLEEMGTAAV